MVYSWVRDNGMILDKIIGVMGFRTSEHSTRNIPEKKISPQKKTRVFYEIGSSQGSRDVVAPPPWDGVSRRNLFHLVAGVRQTSRVRFQITRCPPSC